jgi:hypothetical protein
MGNQASTTKITDKDKVALAKSPIFCYHFALGDLRRVYNAGAFTLCEPLLYVPLIYIFEDHVSIFQGGFESYVKAAVFSKYKDTQLLAVARTSYTAFPIKIGYITTQNIGEDFALLMERAIQALQQAEKDKKSE